MGILSKLFNRGDEKTTEETPEENDTEESS